MQFVKMMRLLPLLAATVPFPAAHAQEMVWNSKQDDGGVYLMASEEGSFHPAIMFLCNPQTRRLIVNYDIGVEVRQQLVVWSSEGGRVELRMGEAPPSVTDSGVEVQGYDGLYVETDLTPALVRILRDGRTLSVRTSSSALDVPLAGAAEGVTALVRACGNI